MKNAKPEGLSPEGEKAYDAIMQVLRENGATNTGEGKAFYSPKEWEERGESYGQGAVLIVVYDGGDHRRFFNMDAAYPTYMSHLKMTNALGAKDLFFEECTGWYAAVYRA
jgi:hypothetical protein